MRSWIFLLLISYTFIAQTQSRESLLQQFIEENFGQQDLPINYEDLYESLYSYILQPIDLNNASYEELYSLYILDHEEILSILNHRDQTDKFLSTYELQAIEGLDLEKISRLLLFCQVKSTSKYTGLRDRFAARDERFLIFRSDQNLQKPQGQKTGIYIGPVGKYYGRFRMASSGNYSIGVTFEKDASEPFYASKKTYGFDYYSFHIQLKQVGAFDQITVGDYQLQTGQGLVFGAGYSPGKGTETINTIRKSDVGARPYTSVIESGFFRGISATYAITESLKTTAFVSHNFQDAAISTPDQNTFFTSGIQTSGLHRTRNEIANKNSLQEISLGFNTVWSPSRQLQVGLNYLHTSFDTPIQKPDYPRNKYEFTGKSNSVSSVYANWNWRNMLLFSETAISSSGGIGSLSGLIASLGSQVDLSLLYRIYTPDFHSFYSRGFAESTRTINESGLYWGLKIRPRKGHQVSAYLDHFRFPWLKYLIDAPSSGYEWLVSYQYRPNKSTSIVSQIRNEVKGITHSADSHAPRSVNASKYNYSIQLNHGFSNGWSIVSRIQGSSRNAITRTKGFGLSQDVNFDFKRIRLSSRFAIFDTDDYANRLYTYEPDVLYAFSMPAYSGSGYRTYVLIQYRASRSVTFWMKYGRFYYPGVEATGSGTEQTSGDVRSQIKFQVRIKW